MLLTNLFDKCKSAINALALSIFALWNIMNATLQHIKMWRLLHKMPSTHHFHYQLHLINGAVMKGFVILTLAIVTIGISATVSRDVNLKDAFSKADTEIKSIIRQQMIAGAKSSKMSRRKITSM